MATTNGLLGMSSKPKLIVFDLEPFVIYTDKDYTLWPFWVDTHVSPPFKLKEDGKVIDRYEHHVTVYPDVPQILERLHSEGYEMAVASRTDCIKEANKLIELFQWNKYFKYKEIFPDCKVSHFKKFQQQSGIPYESMLFFDDEQRNIADVQKLGVTSILADDGMNEDILKEGFEIFANKK